MSLAEKKAVIMRKLQMVKDKMDAIKSNALQETEELKRTLENALDKINEYVREKTDQLKSDRNELNRQLYEIFYTEIFIKKQSELAKPLEFLKMNTGYIEVKYQLLKQWPIVSADLANTTQLLKLHIDVQVQRMELAGEEAFENLQSQQER